MVAAGAWNAASRFNWNTIRPLPWLLRHAARADSASDRALDEIVARLDAKKLDDSQLQTVINRALDGQRFATATGLRVPSWPEMIRPLKETVTDVAAS